jgi:ATP-dependent Clp protease adaptor protein ClpS
MPNIEEELETSLELEEPKMYKVILHNDDYTSMEFVVEVLTMIFHKSEQEAVDIMLQVHQKGKGLCGVYTYEIAQAKVFQVKELAKANEFPLLVTMEEDV